MPDERWQRAKDVFQDALQRPAEERSAYLAETCATDTLLRGEVESLLASYAEAGDFLSRPALDAAAPARGRRIGPYIVLDEIARGGMGSVYRAVRDDDVFRKTVALKLMHGGGSELLSRRFQQERQILASLQHPNIAVILDGGTTDDGQPYLVMEYVEGLPVTHFCAQARVGLRGRLELFQKICAAVQYAHQNLVVHRDIKPANILVTPDGVPKLLDFGIAKLLAAGVEPGSAPTATLLPMMTPEYASPEQIRGESVTTTTDVYSLGVVLYELLAGQRPYELRTSSLEEIVRAVCETEPPPPSAATQVPTAPADTTRLLVRPGDLRGDLDTIVLKALRKDPSRRYGSAQELSEDVRRHLVDLPVLARPDTLGYRAAKFVGRHRRGVAGVAIVALLIVGFALNALLQSVALRKERDKAQRVSAFLVRLFEISDPSASGGRAVSAREMLDKGVERIRTDLRDEPEVRATLLDTMGNVYKSLGLYDTAEPLLREALETRRRVLGRHVDVAKTTTNLAVLLWRKGEYGEAERLLREALALQRQLVGPEHRDITVILTNLASVTADRGDTAAAEGLYREAVAVRRRLGIEKDSELPKMISGLASVVFERGDLAAAEALYREALALQRGNLGASHPDVARTELHVASSLEERGDYAAAEPIYREALKTLRASFGNEHRWVAWAMGDLARLLSRKGDPVTAEELGRGAVAIERKVLGNRHAHLASTLGIVAEILTDKGDPAAAEPMLREALGIARAAVGDESVEVADLLCALGDALRAQGRPADAEAAYREAVALQRRLSGTRPAGLARPLTRLGALLLERDPGAAEPLLREALALRSRALPAGHSDIAATESALGACLAAQGRFAEAEPLLLGSHTRIEAATTSRSSASREARARIVKLYTAWKKPDQAARYVSVRTGPAPR